MPINMSIIKTAVLPVFATLITLTSCSQKYAKDDFQAFFGGEIANPTKRYVLFCKDNEVLDTIPLKDDNTFFIAFRALEPGLYTFRHDPEYQYVYFNKNDSLMVNINSRDFDESIVFCGRGDRKNNFLMELYLRNERAKNDLYPMLDKDVNSYTRHIDSVYNANRNFYNRHKEKYNWEAGFDFYARAMLDFNYYTQKEIYPRVHYARTGNRVKLPEDFYDFRDRIDFNDASLASYAPFLSYVSNMLNNLAAVPDSNEMNQVETELQNNLNKLYIADTLLKSPKIKNTILNSIAFNYLLEDQNSINNQKFLDTYRKLSTDASSKNEILKVGRAIAALRPGRPLPKVEFVTLSGEHITSDALLTDKTIIYFWTENMHSHFIAASKKALAIKAAHPGYEVVAVNLDHNQEKWQKTLSGYNVPGITQVQARDFEDITGKWAIIKIHRTFIINDDGTVKDAFTNLFDADFSQRLQQPGGLK